MAIRARLKGTLSNRMTRTKKKQASRSQHRWAAQTLPQVPHVPGKGKGRGGEAGEREGATP
ncbi:MAG: hypothetical protein HY685_02310 [Chloroflexi bacterium]|nr:hypothetical protein [Chloroflexota bacterium]